LNAKQDTLISGTNIKTVNGSSLLGSGNITIAAGASGIAGAIQFSDGSSLSSDAATFFWNNTNKRLGVGTNSPTHRIHIKGTGNTAATSSLFSENSDASSSIRFNDAGTLTVIASTSTIFTLGLGGIQSYNLKSLGGFGSSQVNVSGVMDLYSNDGTIGLRVNDAFTGIADATAIGQISAPNASAMLDIVSTTKGVLFPRMTTTQKNAIASPVASLVVYDTTTNKLCCYDGTTWNDLF
jgi:hypothetical protein